MNWSQVHSQITFKSNPKIKPKVCSLDIVQSCNWVQLSNTKLNIAKSNSDSPDNNPYHCFFRTSDNNNSQNLSNIVHTNFELGRVISTVVAADPEITGERGESTSSSPPWPSSRWVLHHLRTPTVTRWRWSQAPRRSRPGHNRASVNLFDVENSKFRGQKSISKFPQELHVHTKACGKTCGKD